ncbi:hypothetical protein B5M09_013126 [Aphanomyces astaci]|uniref:Uncharacterized protein n=1 Tax=Aphanomyces astaci TaxID=112090 RepID=A0A3R7W9K0_APHAT|nr:hypothetical protein B5M09_013126 [Aphanomyces astaci]
MDLSANTLKFKVRASIVDTIIGELFFGEADGESDDDDDANEGQEDDGAVATRALALQKRNVTFTDLEGKLHSVVNKNVPHFELATDFMAIGMSFRQITAEIIKTHTRTKNAKLAGISDYMVTGFARMLAAVGLQVMSDLLISNESFAFALAPDSNSLYESSYLNIRLRVAWGSVLFNLHAVVLPMYERHTANYCISLIVRTLDAIAPIWRDKLLGVGSVGENTMTGRHSGVVTQLVAMATYPTVLNPYRDRLHQCWSPAKVEQIEEEHKMLFTAYRDDTNFRAKLDKHTHMTGFNAGWSDIDNNGRKLATIRSFMANLAVVFANTASVEGDFSILKGEKDEFRTSLGHLALEGIFQAKQFEQIRKQYSLLLPSASA